MNLTSLLSCFLFLLFAGTAQGQECLIGTTEVSFGSYDFISKAPLDATGRVTVVCDGAFTFSVKLDQGQNSTGSFNPRVLRAAAAEEGLNYNLFVDSTRQNIWGDGTSNTFVNTGTANNIQIPLTVYGRIPAQQKVPMGSYFDQINVIVEW